MKERTVIKNEGFLVILSEGKKCFYQIDIINQSKGVHELTYDYADEKLTEAEVWGKFIIDSAMNNDFEADFYNSLVKDLVGAKIIEGFDTCYHCGSIILPGQELATVKYGTIHEECLHNYLKLNSY
jgi:hypothetical protein